MYNETKWTWKGPFGFMLRSAELKICKGPIGFMLRPRELKIYKGPFGYQLHLAGDHLEPFQGPPVVHGPPVEDPWFT